MKTGLCCIFNYAPLYRASVFSKIDEAYDAQFYFGKEVRDAVPSGIEKLDYGIFRRKPAEFVNVTHKGRFPWYKGIQGLPFKKDYSVFLVTGEFNWAYLPFLVSCMIMRKKVYGWGHGPKNLNGYAPFRRFFYRAMAGFFVYGEKGRDRMVELGFPGDRISVIYNSLTGRIGDIVSYAGQCRKNLKSSIYADRFGDASPVLVFSGRLMPGKRLDWLVDAVGDINGEGMACNLVMIGDGPEKDSLERLASLKGIGDRVWFFGRTYDEDILAPLLYNADLCVSPGNVGLTALHAMLYGTPVMSHDDFWHQMPEYETIDDGNTGLLFRYGDYDDMKHKIRQWLLSCPDRDSVRMNCYRMIDSKWNSDRQMEVLTSAIRQ